MQPPSSRADGDPDVVMPPDCPWLRHYDPGVPLQIEYPRIPLYRLLDDTAARCPDRPCTNFFGRRLTYRRVKDLSDRFAAGLRRLGVQPGDRVALLLPNSPQFLIAYYGALKAGAVIVPLNPLYTQHELRFYMEDAGIATAVTIPMFLSKVAALRGHTPLRQVIYTRLADYMPLPINLVMGRREAGQMKGVQAGGLVDLRTLLAAPPPAGWQPEPADPDGLALLIYSGGTTGVAKGIMLSHFNCVANACQISAWGHFKPNATGLMLAVLPLFHGFGMSVTMNAPVSMAGEILLIPRFQARDVLKAIQKYRPSFFIGVPTMFVAFNSVPGMGRYNLKSVEGIFVGAAPLTRALKESFESASGARLIEGYGLTEAVTAIMANPYKGRHKIGSIGIPFPDVEMKIVSLQDGRELPPGETGEMVLRSPTVMMGYYHSPEETAKTIVDGWLYTGDIGHRDDDGYFYITDRKKELIIVGGFNVYPREIDELIYAHPKVKEGTVVGIPDARLGERIRAYIVLKEGERATAEEFIAYFRERLTAYKVPSEIEFRSELPKTMIGKILRRVLREEAIRAEPGSAQL